MNRSRGATAKIALFFLSVLVGLVGLELGLRWLGPFQRAGKTPDNVLWDADPEIGFAPASNLRITFYTNEWMNEVRTNGFGFRSVAGQSGPVPPREGTLLFLGDSQTMGVQVPVEFTYVSLIERELKRRGWALKAVNAGSNAFNTVQEYLFFRKLYNQGFRPQIVVMYVTNNDLFEDVPGLPYGRYRVGRDGYLLPLPPDEALLDLLRRAKETPPPKTNFWLQNSAILRHVWYSYRILRTPRDVAGWAKNTYLRDDLDPLARQRWDAATAAIRSLNHLVSSYGGTLLIAVHPDPIEWSDAYYAKVISALPELSGRIDRMKLQRGYRRIAEKLGVQFIDMLQGFPDISVREFRFALDPHANQSGHRVIASQLMKGLERIGVLGRAPGTGSNRTEEVPAAARRAGGG